MPPTQSASPMPVAEQLRRFILQELTALPGRSLSEDAPLFETLLDSTSVLALVSYLEQSFQIEIRDSEVVPANFNTLRRLAAFVESKTQPTRAPLAANG